MIWTLNTTAGLVPRFEDAGPIDETVVAAYTATRNQREPARPGIARYYYLLADDPRITLCCLGMPLHAWTGGAMLIVTSRKIIGEFAGNRAYAGYKGCIVKMQPIAWLRGKADRRFTTGAELLAEVAEQFLDNF